MYKGEAGHAAAHAVHFEEKVAGVTTKIGNLETRILVKVETTLEKQRLFPGGQERWDAQGRKERYGNCLEIGSRHLDKDLQ